VLAGSDLAADPHLAAANWFTVLDHPSAGRHAYAGLPYVIDGQRLIPRRAAPTFGQHNHDVLVGVLGLDDGEQRRLTAAGVLTDVPAPPPP
jgi:crotonobetainyl-CoA:carnitine CoA-transferase CaiB-like acyl-CoA transferase